ncbi:MAG: glycosyltransferase [Sulfitobacter sp.]
MPHLLMIATAPVMPAGDALILDAKFVEGMRQHCALWEGKVDCILHGGATHIPFQTTQNPADLEFGLTVLDPGQPVTRDMLQGYDVVFCAADDHEGLHIAALGAQVGAKVVYTIEYTLQARLQIAWLSKDKSLARRIYSMGWNTWHEIRRRRAFRHAQGVQVNGYPAYRAYKGLNANTMMYLDNRMKPDLFVTDDEMQRRAAHLQSGSPLRLIHSGRLEPMKGAQDLIPVAQRLQGKGINFQLDIYGAGSLRDEIADQINSKNLGDHVTLHDPVDFEDVLVPVSRTCADIFLSCHRQSDPSCTYLESMGCGLAIVGYANQMWSAVQAQAQAGWAVPLGDVGALADTIATLNADRDQIVAACTASVAFAQARDFQTEFGRRMDHLAATLRQG